MIRYFERLAVAYRAVGKEAHAANADAQIVKLQALPITA